MHETYGAARERVVSLVRGILIQPDDARTDTFMLNYNRIRVTKENGRGGKLSRDPRHNN